MRLEGLEIERMLWSWCKGWCFHSEAEKLGAVPLTTRIAAGKATASVACFINSSSVPSPDELHRWANKQPVMTCSICWFVLFLMKLILCQSRIPCFNYCIEAVLRLCYIVLSSSFNMMGCLFKVGRPRDTRSISFGEPFGTPLSHICATSIILLGHVLKAGIFLWVTCPCVPTSSSCVLESR